MKKSIVFLILFIYSSVNALEVKLKDLARIDGLRDNQITGYGLVTGLSHSGDTKNFITSESLKNYLKNQGLSAANNPAFTKNIASVMITANVPVYAKPGDRIDITVSSIGDAKSLEGGVLIQSPLKAANGDIIAVASGIISFGGKDLKMYNNLARTNPKTVGTIQGGGIVERELKPVYVTKKKDDPNAPDSPKYKTVSIILHDQDFATLDSVNQKIRETFKIEKVETNITSPIEIQVNIPEDIETVTILGKLENILITPETKARVVINERTGTIIMGANVTVDEVAISKQGISVIISGGGGGNRRFYEENPEKVENVLMVKESTSVADLVKALNKVGASTKDVIAILEGLRKSGALHAEVIVQ